MVSALLLPDASCGALRGPFRGVSCFLGRGLGSAIVLLTKTGPRCVSFRCKITVSLAQGAVHDAEADVADPVFVRSTISKCDRGILRLRRILITVNLVLSGGLAASSLGAPAQRRCYGAVGGFHPASTFAGLAHSSSATRVLQPPLCGRVLASLSPRTACDHVPLSLLLRLPAPARPCWPRPSVKNESAITGTCTRRTHCSACHPVSSFCWLLVGDGT